MNNRKIAATLIAAIASSVHSQEIRDVHYTSHITAQIAAKDTANDTQTPNHPSKRGDTAKRREGNTDTGAKNNDPKKSDELFPAANFLKVLATDYGNDILALIALGALAAGIWTAWITRTNGNRQLRGYAGVEDLIFADPHTTLTIKNYGQTPASDVKVWLDWGSPSKDSTTLRGDPQGQVFERGVINPAKTTACAHPCRGPVTGFFIYGTISYTDIFGENQTTTFQYIVGYPPGRHPTCTVHSEGNSAT